MQMLECKPTDIMDCASINNLGHVLYVTLSMYIKLEIINNKDENVHRYGNRVKKLNFLWGKNQRYVFKITIQRRHLTCTKTTLAY